MLHLLFGFDSIGKTESCPGALQNAVSATFYSGSTLQFNSVRVDGHTSLGKQQGNLFSIAEWHQALAWLVVFSDFRFFGHTSSFLKNTTGWQAPGFVGLGSVENINWRDPWGRSPVYDKDHMYHPDEVKRRALLPLKCSAAMQV